MSKRRVLVFPCGSEIGLEVHRSLSWSTHVDLIGASSADDHGRFVYRDYIGGLPYIDDPALVPSLNRIVRERGIDAIYPTMDQVIAVLKPLEPELGCRVVSSASVTAAICLSKSATYAALSGAVKTPRVYETVGEAVFPVFVKPDVGYGSRGVFMADSLTALQTFLARSPGRGYVVSEFLPGREFTVDCFTQKGELIFVGPRCRERVANGISVGTSGVGEEAGALGEMAAQINRALEFRGAWFFQAKNDASGELTLLEVAPRLAGASAMQRARGVNLALMSMYDAFDEDVEVLINDHEVSLDRALQNRYRTTLTFSAVYIDLDDTLLVDEKVNVEAVGFLFKCRNEAKRLILITRHAGDLEATLAKYRLSAMFDEIVHVADGDEKSRHIDPRGAIFVDDSFSERRKVSRAHGIPVFGVDMIESLLWQ